MQRATISFTLILIMGFNIAISTQAEATLIVRGQGTSIYGTYNLIYDTDRDITWYDYSFSSYSWWVQNARAVNLSVTFGNKIYTDWRLPKVDDIDEHQGCSWWSFNGPYCGYNVDTSKSEIAHLFYDELNNLANFDTSGNYQPVHGLRNKGPFQNLYESSYWLSAYKGSDRFAWRFKFDNGLQTINSKNMHYYAIAVRNGDVAPVPEPSTFLLLGGGLLGIAGLRRKFKK